MGWGLLIGLYLPCLPLVFVYGGKCTTHIKWNLKSFNFLCMPWFYKYERQAIQPSNCHVLETKCIIWLTRFLVFFFLTDCKFINYPPSMIAAGSVGAAAHGLLKTDNTKMLQSLHQILNIDVVGVHLLIGKVFNYRRCINVLVKLLQE